MTRREWLKAATGVAVGAAVGAGAHGYSFERLHLEVTRARLPVFGLPPALAGLRLGLVTDIHLSAMVPRALVDRAVRLLLDERPDLIMLGGDYVTWGDRRFVEPAADVLRPLTAPLGVFAVLGNHDDDRDMPRALSRVGFDVLKDARTTLTIRGERVDLVGLRYWTRSLGSLARLARGAGPTTLLVAHDPRRLRQASELGVPLVLSGHTHGGQVVLPGVGAIAARKFPVLAGIARRAHTTLFVSRGVGTVYVPCRVNCPPEVAVLTLDQESQSGNPKSGMSDASLSGG